MSSRKQARQASGMRLTAPTAIRYNGSIKGKLNNQSVQPIEVTITQQVDAGTRVNVFFVGPSTPVAANFASNNTVQFANYAALYDEFRVLGMQLLAAPTFTNLGYMGAFRSVEDPPSIGTLFQEIAQLNGFKFCSSTHQTSMSIKMDGADEAGWLSTDTTTSATDLKYTGIAFGSQTATVPLVVTWRVQFRSSKPVTQTVVRRRVQDLTFTYQEEDSGEKVEDEESHPVLLTREQRELLRSSLKL